LPSLDVLRGFFYRGIGSPSITRHGGRRGRQKSPFGENAKPLKHRNWGIPENRFSWFCRLVGSKGRHGGRRRDFSHIPYQTYILNIISPPCREESGFPEACPGGRPPLARKNKSRLSAAKSGRQMMKPGNYFPGNVAAGKELFPNSAASGKATGKAAPSRNFARRGCLATKGKRRAAFAPCLIFPRQFLDTG
jgi:hypothetical protein